MSNSVHRQWLKPLLSAALSPSASVLPSFAPLQVSEVAAPEDSARALPSHLAARMLLSDKHLSVWCVVTTQALRSFQETFPEFDPVKQGDRHALLRLTGGIVLPTRMRVQIHPNLAECLLHIDALEYKGGAGNNEFGRPIFHTEDKDIALLLQRYRNVDLSPLFDQEAVAAPPRAAASATATSPAAWAPGADTPFVPALRALIDAHARDPRQARLDLEAVVSAEQQEQLDGIDEGFRSKKARLASSSAAGNDADASAFLLSPVSFSQLDSYHAELLAGGGSAGPVTQGHFSQEIDVPAAHFSQRDADPAAATAAQAKGQIPALATVLEGKEASTAASASTAAQSSAAAPAPSAAAAAPTQSATQRFLQRCLRAEGYDEDMPPHRPAAAAASSQHQRPVIVTPPAQAPAAVAAAAPLSPAAKRRSALSGSSLPPPSPSQPSPCKSLRPSVSPCHSPLPPSPSLPHSPARVISQQHAAECGQSASPLLGQPPSQESLHNLPIEDDAVFLPSDEQPPPSAGEGVVADLPPHTQAPHAMDDVGDEEDEADGNDALDEEERAAYARQEASCFPFLTQAPQASEEDQLDDEDDEADEHNDHHQPGAPKQVTVPAIPPRVVRSSSPMEVDSPQPRGRKSASQHSSNSFSSLVIPPTPSAESSARSSAANSTKGSPLQLNAKAAAVVPIPPASASSLAVAKPVTAAAAADYSADAIARRQAARERQLAEALEAEERARAADAERERRRKEAAEAAARAAEEERTRLAVEKALEEERTRVAAQRAAEEASRAAAAAAAAVASDPLSDEEAYQLTAGLRDSPAKRSFHQMSTAAVPTKRGRGRPPGGGGGGSSSAVAPSPASKRPRLPLNRQSAVPVPSSAPVGRLEQALPVFVEESLRRAVEAMERVEQRQAGGPAASRQRTLKFPALPLSSVSSSSSHTRNAVASFSSALGVPTPAPAAASAAAAAAASATPAAVASAGALPTSVASEAAVVPVAANDEDDDDMPPLSPGIPAAAATAGSRAGVGKRAMRSNQDAVAVATPAAAAPVPAAPVPAARASLVASSAVSSAVSEEAGPIASTAAATVPSSSRAVFGVAGMQVSVAQVRSAIRAHRAAKAQTQANTDQTAHGADSTEAEPTMAARPNMARKPSAASRAAALTPAAADEEEQKSAGASAKQTRGRTAPRSAPAARVR